MSRRCLLLLIDGLRPDVAEDELRAGRLPNLARLISSGGAGRAITSFPSTTSVSYLPFFTGCTPGRCNVPSIRWLDRTCYAGRWYRNRGAVRSYCGYQAGMLDADIAPDVRTIFQIVPESVGIFTMVTRGLPRERNPARLERGFWGVMGHYLQWHQPSDAAAAGHLLRAAAEPHRFIFAQFPAVDGYTHQADPQGPKVVRALSRIDGVIGRLLETLSARGELSDTLILVVSDHGASVVRHHLDLADWFRRQGVTTLSHPVIWERNPGAAVMVAGNGSAMVYAQPQVPRTERWPLERLRRPDAFGTRPDLIARLLAEPAVALIAAEGSQGSVTVADAQGEAELQQDAGRILYSPRTADPLAVGGSFRGTPREWLERSWDLPMPDGAFQLLDQFRASRTGDLLVIANEGFDFRERFEVPEHRSGHGSLIRAHMQTPLWSNHPLPSVPLRTIDLFPTMLDWLGEPTPPGIDGELVWRAR
ncbi:MAG TPA: alkaline phosphatase family protein [Gemmatimonadales bacterium]|nr:alkaline phosphatase family protein [Gemmatimonadales bacterium]